MTAATHPWTFIHPACGRPAMHASIIPRAAGGIAPAELEHLTGQSFLYRDPDGTMFRRDPLLCDSCRASLTAMDLASMTVEANWRRREELGAADYHAVDHHSAMAMLLPPVGPA